MYKDEEVGEFGNPETKLKQIQLKLTESEQRCSTLKGENMALKRKLAITDKFVPEGLAAELSSLLLEMGKLCFKNFDEHITLRGKYNLNEFANVREKEEVKEKLGQAFGLINRKDDFHQVFERE